MAKDRSGDAEEHETEVRFLLYDQTEKAGIGPGPSQTEVCIIWDPHCRLKTLRIGRERLGVVRCRQLVALIQKHILG